MDLSSKWEGGDGMGTSPQLQIKLATCVECLRGGQVRSVFRLLDLTTLLYVTPKRLRQQLSLNPPSKPTSEA